MKTSKNVLQSLLLTLNASHNENTLPADEDQHSRGIKSIKFTKDSFQYGDVQVIIISKKYELDNSMLEDGFFMDIMEQFTIYAYSSKR